MGVNPSQFPPGTPPELIVEDDTQEDSSEENRSMQHNFHVYHGCVKIVLFCAWDCSLSSNTSHIIIKMHRSGHKSKDVYI